MRSLIRSQKSLGNAIRRARRAAGLTQQQLGARTNLRQATISNLEKGEGGSLETLFAVLTFLELELELRARSISAPPLEDIF